MTFNISIITNWSSFCHDLTLSHESVHVMHMPLLIARDAIFRDQCVLFNMNKDTQAILFGCRSIDIVKDAMDKNNLSMDILVDRVY